ncbi:MAG: hypothetical protein Fur0015_02400 [Ignavibacteriales bacterium]
MTKKIFFILLIILWVNSINIAQLKSINFFSDYSTALTKRLNVTNAKAIGGGVNVEFDLGKNFSVCLESGYKLYSISQKNQLLGWGWDFWNNRYSNKIKSDLQADKNLSVSINSSQKLGIIPVILSAKYSYPLSEKFIVSPNFGGGVLFYTRTLYVIEDWSKKFPTENYTFEYSYRNFAPSKKGNPFVARGGIDINYNFMSNFWINAEASYSKIFNSGSKYGFNNFLFESELSTKFGIIFRY